jgi:uncharacterized pyridoxamine 5'-phosphate oxidase family protein
MDFYNFYIQQIPIPIASTAEQGVFIRLVDYILFLKKQNLTDANDKTMVNFIHSVVNGLVFELYYGESMKKANKDIFKFMQNLPDITLLTNEQEKLETIRNILKSMRKPENSVAQNLYYLNSVPEIKVVYSHEYVR